MQHNPSYKLDLSADAFAIVLRILDKHVAHYTVWAFGSRVSGKARPYSDLDLVIVDQQPLSLEKMADLAAAFDESDLPFKVDIVDWAKTDATFRQIIDGCKIVLRENANV